MIKPLKVLHVSHSYGGGGAGKGAARLHQAFLQNGIDSHLITLENNSDDPDPHNVVICAHAREQRNARRKLSRWIMRQQSSANPVVKSLNLFNSGLLKDINAFECDIVQLHWVGYGTLSIWEIGKINKPVVWKLPDMYAFSGTEHYLLPDDPPRHVEGYRATNRPDHEAGIDINKWLWRCKRVAWRGRNISVVAPSRWLRDQARQSRIFRESRTAHIINPLDSEIYKFDRSLTSNNVWGIKKNRHTFLLGFGSLNATHDPRKGYEHLLKALEIIRKQRSVGSLELLIFGGRQKGTTNVAGFRAYELGRLRTDEDIISAYNLCDGFVLPTLQDNLPNTVKEASCCGLPVAAYEVGGLPDLVEHLVTGYLARPRDPNDLADGIQWLVNNRSMNLRECIANKSAMRHSPARATESYSKFYEQVLHG